MTHSSIEEIKSRTVKAKPLFKKAEEVKLSKNDFESLLSMANDSIELKHNSKMLLKVSSSSIDALERAYTDLERGYIDSEKYKSLFSEAKHRVKKIIDLVKGSQL